MPRSFGKSPKALVKFLSADSSYYASIVFNSGILLRREDVMCALFRGFRRCLFLVPNTLSCFIHCNGSRLLIYVLRVRPRRHKSSYLEEVQLRRPNPTWRVGFSRKAQAKHGSHGERYDSKSDNTCNPHESFLAHCVPTLVNPLLMPVHQIFRHRMHSRDVRPRFRTYGFSVLVRPSYRLVRHCSSSGHQAHCAPLKGQHRRYEYAQIM